MNSKVASGIMLTVLLIGMLALTFSVFHRSVLGVEQGSIGPGTLPDWHEDAQVQLGWIFGDPTNPQNSIPLPGWNISVGDIPVWDYDPNRTAWDQPAQWYIRIPNVNVDKPVKHFWICWVYDFDTYLPGLRSATNLEWFPDDGSGNFQYIEEWFDSDGNLTTNYLEAVYARATLSLDLYPNPQYEDIWLGTHGSIALAREIYIMTLCTEVYTHIYFNLNPNPASVGDTLTLKGILVDELSAPVANATVKLYARPIAGSWMYITSVITNEYGIFTWQVTIPSITGTFVFAAYYPRFESYESSSNIAILIIESAAMSGEASATSLYFNLNPDPISAGQTLTVEGILVDAVSEPLSGATVQLYARPLVGSWIPITSLTTNSYGVFKWQVTIPAVSGTYIFAALYPGSGTYEMSYNFAILIIQPPS